ncbi:ileal sodium/bile acid cotransporter-like [Centruroides sculpturatus]|uniref:ileal sodium/bile acid cotransporter-like n=1 Tax=Centruroides sculpturatus TaxID=218467 RepID=UPI000C6CFE90|nr:ileal sodium/bile acid cotransporter-like [Centruroides sculpturatus]
MSTSVACFFLLLKLTTAFNLTFHPSSVKIIEEQKEWVNFNSSDETWEGAKLELKVDDADIADITDSVVNYEQLYGNLTVEGKFLGRTKVRACLHSKWNNNCQTLPVTVLKKERAVTKAFIISVAIIVTLSYVNMGCAVDLTVVKNVLLKPFGPIVGFLCQYLIMPLIAYGVGHLLFNDPVMRLGLFTFGCSPSGGASNIWTVLLNGNLNLSLTVTFINNVLALGMMPLWLFTLGRSLFVTTNVSGPFRNICVTLISMIVPLGIGLLIQKFFPRVGKFLKRILAIVSGVIIIFIVMFGIYANLYMFKLFSWKIVGAAIINVWTGFAIASVAAYAAGLPMEDRIAVMVETGIQNTGVAYVLLNSSLSQPDSDIASVVPVAGSIVTPVPLALIYLYQKLRSKNFFGFYGSNTITDEEKKQIIRS